jgi:hypothetical protein
MTSNVETHYTLRGRALGGASKTPVIGGRKTKDRLRGITGQWLKGKVAPGPDIASQSSGFRVSGRATLRIEGPHIPRH